MANVLIKGSTTIATGGIISASDFSSATVDITGSNVSVPGNLVIQSKTNLGAVGNITITGGTAGQVLTTNGSGVLSWTTK
jgi:hypothetical protein